MRSNFAALCAVAAVCAAAVSAVALAEERNTQRSNPDQSTLVAGGVVEAGYMVCVWTNGLAYAAADTNALAGAVVAGVASKTSAPGEACFVQRGKFRLDNADAALTAADIGRDVYVAGPASVTTQAKASQDIRAGILAAMATSGTDGTNNAVWVNIRF